MKILLLNSTKWPALNVWVLNAQLVQHCSTDPEAKGFYPVEALKFFFKLILQLLKLRLPL